MYLTQENHAVDYRTVRYSREELSHRVEVDGQIAVSGTPRCAIEINSMKRETLPEAALFQVLQPKDHFQICAESGPQG